MAIVNIGILAHVDAGKTSLTERILFQTGIIRTLGSVDKGTTQTDTLELERARGITIKSAIVSFQLHDLTVNLIDTPGHADFVAEVERSLRVLDGVVLVVSAVEGVQPQTRRIVRAARAAGLPLLIFVNKIDRLGARGETLLDDLRRKLNLRVVAMNAPSGLGTRAAEVNPLDRDAPSWREMVADLLSESDERVIEAFERSDGRLGRAYLEPALREQVAAGQVVPVFFGSAITGAGVAELLEGVEEWLPPATAASEAPLSGAIFKIASRPTGEKVVYARLFAGSLTTRQQVTMHRPDAIGETEPFAERITAIDRFLSGPAGQSDVAGAGEIVGLHGLRCARIGDVIGDGCPSRHAIGQAFPEPALESNVYPIDPAQITRLRAALEELAEQDPLITLRQRNEEGKISLRLYGEVQKEVVAETLWREYGVRVGYGPTLTVCIERPVGAGEHAEFMGQPGNPFLATVGLRIESAACASGVRYQYEPGSLPHAFYRAIEQTVAETLEQGLSGWEVTDCSVTLTQVGYSSVASTAGDFRKLTPLVLMQALLAAGTEVCEPVEELELEIPEESFSPVCGALLNARGVVRTVAREGASCHLVCEIPTAELRAFEHQLPRLTHGDGGWVSNLAGYVPVTGQMPARTRTGPNPLNREHYLAELARS
jgi:ribosomal protection tetracycline resistance protein